MPSQYDDALRPLVAKWLELLKAAETSKRPFQDVADQLMGFYAAKTGFLFEKAFREKYLGLTNENSIPRHRFTFNKSFEFVAIFGPMLYWDNPARTVKPRRRLEITPEQFGITPPMQQQWQQFQQQTQQYQEAVTQYQQMMQQGPPPPTPPQPGQPPQPPAQWPPQPPQQPPPIDPNIQQMMGLWDWSQQTMQQRAVADGIRCQLLEGWLNYIPGESPNGGLAHQSRLAIVEALVKGMGVLWSAPYQFPGSEKVIIASMYDTVDNLYIDPDATSLADAKWIMQRVVAPVYQIEEEFSLTPGSLNGKGAMSVSTPQKMNPIGTPGDSGALRKDKVGRSSEYLTYYKVWSKCGVGTKLISHFDEEMKANLERVSGKFAFLCICDNVPYPLNLPADQLETMNDEEVSKRLEWPFPSWKDDRWPCATISFYEHPNRAWPIAPLAPALGELIFLNLTMCRLADRIEKSSRDFIAVAQSASEEIENAIKNGGDLTVLPLTEVHKNIHEVIQFLQQPETRHDYWEIVDRVNHLFERRTGLTEMMAGQTGTQSRSAADANIKGAQLNVRPEDMQRRVEEWMTDAAKLEKIATRWFIEPKDVESLFGPVGSYLWQTYITSADPEATIRETDCSIEPGSVRKPNKQRDVENVNTLIQFIAPVLSQIYQTQGNPGPLSWLLNQISKVYDMDITGLELPAPQPPQPPQPDQTQMQMQQMEMQQRQAEIQATQQKGQLDAQMLQAKGQMDGQKFQLEMAKLQAELQIQQKEIEAKQLQSQTDLQKVMIAQQQSQQDAAVNSQRAQVKLMGDAAGFEMSKRKADAELKAQTDKARLELSVAELKAQQEAAHRAQIQHEKQQQELFKDPIGRLFGDKGKE